MLIREINELNQIASDMESVYEDNLKKVEEDYNTPIDRLKEIQKGISNKMDAQRKMVRKIESL
ncbi:MAG: hypothetical protein LBU10_00950 [Endomicrobium sp.]|jgi:hypothetical protein|nr:hypothetical protein [Endomicrobium sp.]